MTEKYIYGKKISTVRDASGISGIIIKLMDGSIAFRVYENDKSSFTDYALNHDDLPVTIEAGSLASFYSSGEDHALDHSPEVLGLKKACRVASSPKRSTSDGNLTPKPLLFVKKTHYESLTMRVPSIML